VEEQFVTSLTTHLQITKCIFTSFHQYTGWLQDEGEFFNCKREIADIILEDSYHNMWTELSRFIVNDTVLTAENIESNRCEIDCEEPILSTLDCREQYGRYPNRIRTGKFPTTSQKRLLER
jgi:hypothetical protein